MNKLSHQHLKENGFSLVELLIVVVIVGILCSIAIPNFLASQRAANEASAISGLRSIFNAEHVYASSNSGSFATLNELHTAGHIDSSIGIAPNTKSRYKYEATPDNVGNPRTFVAIAKPIIHVSTNPIMGSGTRNFGVCETGVVYQRSDNTDVTLDANRVDTLATPIGN